MGGARPPVGTTSGVTRELRIPTPDSELFVVDTQSGAPPLVFLNGAFATLQTWNRVLERLGPRFRGIRFDARGRGKSSPSADYSVQSAVDDVGRVVAATEVERPVVVGWSHGATLAVRYAAQHPEQVAGLVLVDGAYPVVMLDEAGQEKVRAQFRRLGWLMRIMAVFGRSTRMTPAESAAVVIGMDAVNGELVGDFAALRCPSVFVVGTGGHAGASADEMRRSRAAVTVAEAQNPLVSVFATSPRKHTQILSKDPDTVAAAIEAVVQTSS
jgi:pimeloyl-ACP methyl ester carboxylesterase